MKIPSYRVRNFFTDNGKRELKRDSLPGNPDLAKTQSSIGQLIVKDSIGSIKNISTGFLIDKNGFLLGPEYLLKTEPGDTITFSITTLRKYLPQISSEYIGKFGDEGVVQVTLPVKKVFENQEYDTALLKIDIPELQDPWSIVSFSDEKFYLGHETTTLSENSSTIGQFLHVNFRPKFSFITTNEIDRDEVGSPCFYNEKALGIATRYMNSFARRTFGALNMFSSGVIPNRLFGKVTYNVSHIALSQLLRRETGMNLFRLEEDQTLMSSDKVRHKLQGA